MRSAPPDALIERFRRDVLDCEGSAPDLPMGVCVSGGPDSIALLLLAKAAFPDIEAATVDHGLRPESAAEAAYVAGLCEGLGVPHETLALGAPGRGNLSDWARRERYGALVDWAGRRGRQLLMTAHHADDQLETMVMRLNRGSGVAGLAGIRGVRDGLSRPLLGWRKAELEAIVRGCGIVAIDDPSNRDDRFDRARLRKALASADWLDPVAASRSASALAEAEEALDWAAQMYEYRQVSATGGEIRFDPGHLPREINRRITISCLKRVNPAANPRGEALDRLIAALWAGETSTLAGVLCTGGAMWRFSPEPPRRKI